MLNHPDVCVIYGWNAVLFLFGSVQTAVINVFKGGGLQNNELYTLNENIRYVGKLCAQSPSGVKQVVRCGVRCVRGKVHVQLPLLPLGSRGCVSKV